MIRGMFAAFLAVLAAAPAMAKDQPAAPVRGVPGAGWSSVPIPADTGEHIYQRYCFACHAAGPEHPGTQALQAKYKGTKPAELDRRTDLTAAFVTYTVRHGVSVMPSIRPTEITDAELKAIAAYLSRKRR